MAIIDSLYDVLSAASGALVGAVVTHLMTRTKSRNVSNQLVVSRQALEKIQQENERLLQSIHEKENLILKMQVEMLGDKADGTLERPRKKSKKK